MPFTPAHVVAAVPLAPLLGRSAVVSALAIGSVTPDLAYFLPLGVTRSESHSLAALVWFCLPVGVGVYGFFHLCVAPLLHDVSPARVRERLPETWASGRLPQKTLGAVALSVTIGAATHLAWDSFTHYGTPLTRAVPMLGMRVGDLFGLPVRPVRIAQHVSTALGLVLLGIWGKRWLEQTPRVARRPAPPVALAALIVAALVLPALVYGVSMTRDRAQLVAPAPEVSMFIAEGLVVFGGRAFCASLVLVAVVWRLGRDRVHRLSPSSWSSPPRTAPPDRR